MLRATQRANFVAAEDAFVTHSKRCLATNASMSASNVSGEAPEPQEGDLMTDSGSDGGQDFLEKLKAQFGAGDDEKTESGEGDSA